ncbi:MAG: hypothetical protein ACXWNW_13545 [Isosphaeraceae bacterium]
MLEPGEDPGFVSLSAGNFQGHQATPQVHLLRQEDSRKRPPAKLDHQPEAVQLVANARLGRAGYRTVLPATAVAVDSRRMGQLFPGAGAPAPAGSQTRAGTNRSRRHRRERLIQQGRADGKGILRPELLRRGRLVVEPEPTRHRIRAMGR